MGGEHDPHEWLDDADGFEVDRELDDPSGDDREFDEDGRPDVGGSLPVFHIVDAYSESGRFDPDDSEDDSDDSDRAGAFGPRERSSRGWFEEEIDVGFHAVVGDHRVMNQDQDAPHGKERDTLYLAAGTLNFSPWQSWFAYGTPRFDDKHMEIMGGNPDLNPDE